MSEELKPWIVCAACWNFESGTMLAGARHFDMVMVSQLEAMDECLLAAINKQWEQGFIDQFGTFYTREEALKIAKENGQFKRRGEAPAHLLFSEDLY